MAENYLEMLAKLQAQGLETLKQAQEAHIATLNTVRESVREMAATLPGAPQVPTIEGLPTFAQLTELNTKFAAQVLEQQKAYATRIAELFAPVQSTQK